MKKSALLKGNGSWPWRVIFLHEPERLLIVIRSDIHPLAGRSAAVPAGSDHASGPGRDNLP